MNYIQCPHCNAFMYIEGLTEHTAAWFCKNEKCGKKFKARIVLKSVKYVEVTHETQLELKNPTTKHIGKYESLYTRHY